MEATNSVLLGRILTIIGLTAAPVTPDATATISSSAALPGVHLFQKEFNQTDF
jgi:hypothetical protein